MPNPRRPRVAAIGLDDSQLASIAGLSGTLRPADTLSDYLADYPWTETDVMVSSGLKKPIVETSINLITIGTNDFYWSDWFRGKGGQRREYARTDAGNTERELRVSHACPDLYGTLAAELTRQLGQAGGPPSVISSSRKNRKALVETTSGHPVALRLDFPPRSTAAKGDSSRPMALLLPEVPNLAAWFRAFLVDIHASDPGRVPHAPPRLLRPSAWYTPQEKDLADRISRVKSYIERLTDERDQLRTKLAAEGERADNGIRRILWSDGDELVAASEQVLSDLGFEVRNMDAERSQGEPKREDLRLTLPDRPGWEALAEVKGYTSGTRTNDALQIRKFRERYIAEERRPPELTLWLANPFRTLDPSSRPAPDQNVKEAAANVGAVHVLATDLYRQWRLVAADRLGADTVVQGLVNAARALWTP